MMMMIIPATDIQLMFIKCVITRYHMYRKTNTIKNFNAVKGRAFHTYYFSALCSVLICAFIHQFV